MITVDFIFGATFPCIFCGGLTAHGVSVDLKWVSVCRVCAVYKTYDDINAKDVSISKREIYETNLAD